MAVTWSVHFQAFAKEACVVRSLVHPLSESIALTWFDIFTPGRLLVAHQSNEEQSHVADKVADRLLCGVGTNTFADCPQCLDQRMAWGAWGGM